jgi:hypothetical protein
MLAFLVSVTSFSPDPEFYNQQGIDISLLQTSITALGPNKSHIQLVPGAFFHKNKAAEA